MHKSCFFRFLLVALVCVAPTLTPRPAIGQTAPAPFGGAGASAWMAMTYEQLRPLIAQLPCPLPGLPPELARLVDCRVLRPVPDATPHPPTPPPQGGTPASVDHRAQGLVGAVRDQGLVGSCEANAIAGLIDTYTRLRRLNAQPASALHVFAIYERTNINGVDKDDLGNLLRVSGVTSESVWPYDPIKACRIALGGEASGCDASYHVQAGSAYADPTLVAERRRADGMPAYRIAAIETIAQTGRDGAQINAAAAQNEIVKILATGEAVLLGVDMGTNWTSAAGVRGVEVLPEPRGYYGSHALLAQGYRSTATGTQLLVQNSWGTGWGQGGFIWIPEDILRARLRDAYRVRVELTTDPRNAANAPAAPLPPPTSGPAAAPAQTCPAGYSLVLGMCVPALPPCAAGTVPSFANPCMPR
jgi:hypothetical protein